MHIFHSFIEHIYWEPTGGSRTWGQTVNKTASTRCPPGTGFPVSEVLTVASAFSPPGSLLPFPLLPPALEGGEPRAEVLAPQQAHGLIFNQLVSPVHTVGRLRAGILQVWSGNA